MPLFTLCLSDTKYTEISYVWTDMDDAQSCSECEIQHNLENTELLDNNIYDFRIVLTLIKVIVKLILSIDNKRCFSDRWCPMAFKIVKSQM